MGSADDRIRDLYSSRWSAIFTRLAADRYGRITDPYQLMEDARQQVALAIDRRLKAGEGEALSDNYVLIAFKNAMTDLYRRRHGRMQPRAWLVALGSLGQLIFLHYCIGRLPRGEVLASLRADPELAFDPPDPTRVKALLDEMDRVRECEHRRPQEESIFGEEGLALDPPDERSPESHLIREQGLAIQALLFQGAGGDMPSIRAFISRIEAVRTHLGQRVELDDEQRFILHASLAGDLTEKRMGQLLGGLTVRQVRYRREQALEKLSLLLRAAGIDSEALLSPEAA